MKDSDSETIDIFFHNLAEKIVNTFYNNILVEKRISETKYHYTVNLEVDNLIKSLKNKSKELSILISESLQIKNIESIDNLLQKQFSSNSFAEKINSTSKDFDTDGKLDIDSYILDKVTFIKFCLKEDSIKEKIIDLKDFDNFYDWVKGHKESVLCGYSLVIFMLTFSYYVFIN